MRRATFHYFDLSGVWYDFYPRSPCGERHHRILLQRSADYFYPRSPCGERQANNRTEQQAQRISIHALLAESDVGRFKTIRIHPRFLSTLSLRRATDDILAGVNELLISIHALLAESDVLYVITVPSNNAFLSTLSLRRATSSPAYLMGWESISIHALLAESDISARCAAPCAQSFLSTLSLRRATARKHRTRGAV